MTNSTKIILAIAGLALIGGVAIAFKNTPSKNPIAQSGVYCTSDGTLSNAMPIQSHRSYCIEPGPTGGGYTASTSTAYSFSIVDDQGNILKDFQITHTKLLHLIVVRKDLAYFQHLHPEFDQATGKFTLSDLTFPVDGEYRIFADFAPAGAQMDAMGMPLTATPYEDVTVGNGSNYMPQPLGSEDATKTFDGLKVTLATHGTPASGAESMLMFNLSENGKPVTDLEPYLGALGHAVILREGNLDFIHAHPIEDVATKQNGLVDFMVDFPEAGKYKVFTQFQRGGKVITTDFVITVTQGTSAPSSGMQSMPGMNMPGM